MNALQQTELKFDFGDDEQAAGAAQPRAEQENEAARTVPLPPSESEPPVEDDVDAPGEESSAQAMTESFEAAPAQEAEASQAQTQETERPAPDHDDSAERADQGLTQVYEPADSRDAEAPHEDSSSERMTASLEAESEPPAQNAGVSEAEAQAEQPAPDDDGPAERAEQALTQAHEAVESPDDDETIEAYMANLLRRIGGDPEKVEQVRPKADQAAPSSKPSNEQPSKEGGGVDLEKKPQRSRRPASTPIEQRDQMSAMREIANDSVRTHVEHHSSQQLVRGLLEKLTVALVAILVSIVLAMLAGQFGPTAWVGAVVTFLAAVRWTFQYCRLAGKLKQRFAAAPPAQHE